MKKYIFAGIQNKNGLNLQNDTHTCIYNICSFIRDHRWPAKAQTSQQRRTEVRANTAHMHMYRNRKRLSRQKQGQCIYSEWFYAEATLGSASVCCKFFSLLFYELYVRVYLLVF